MERCAYSDGVRLVDSRQDCAKLLSGDEETLGKHLFGAQKHAQIVQIEAAEACSNKIVLVIFYSGWCQPSSLLGCMLSKTTLGNLIFFCRSWHHLVEISGTSGLHKTIGEKEMQMKKGTTSIVWGRPVVYRQPYPLSILFVLVFLPGFCILWLSLLLLYSPSLSLLSTSMRVLHNGNDGHPWRRSGF